MHLRPTCVSHGCTRTARGGYVILDQKPGGDLGMRVDLACLRHRFAVRRALNKLDTRHGRAIWVWGTTRDVVLWAHAKGRCDGTAFTSVTPQRR